MMRSLFSGVSGLRVHQTKMDVIGNNVANVNTVGFKAQRVTFRDAFYQRIQGAAGANPETGRAGTNPMQIGLGATLGSIDNLMGQGLSQRTDRSLDVMIQGTGMFVVSDESGMYFTRAGNVDIDSEMNLHINGMRLMGWDRRKVDGEWVIETGPVKPLEIGGEKQNMEPEATSVIDMIGNLSPEGLVNNQTTRTMTFLDTLGNQHVVDVVFTYHGEQSGGVGDPIHGFWTYEFKTEFDSASVGGQTRQFAVQAYPEGDTKRERGKRIGIHVGSQSNSGSIANNLLVPGNLLSELVPKGLLVFDTNGKLVAAETLKDDQVIGGAAAMSAALDGNGMLQRTLDFSQPMISSLIRDNITNIALYLAPADALEPPATFGKPSQPEWTVDYDLAYTNGEDVKRIGQIDLDIRDLTQWEGKNASIKYVEKDGNPPGKLRDVSVGPDGKITGRYSNGKTRLLGQIPVAQFQNPAGLEKVGNNLYAVTTNSGPFDGIGETGDIMGGALEMSNVDLSQEFTEMITTQRGFQANSRIITTSDDMLQELVNLKR